MNMPKLSKLFLCIYILEYLENTEREYLNKYLE